MIKVELVDKMGNDLTVANVARVSFDKWKDVQDEKDVRLISFLAEHRHTTPFRHPHVMLRCQAPIALARQLGKHQVGMSWNEVSRRYVKVDFSFYQPDAWREAPEGSIKQGSAGVHRDTEIIQKRYQEECDRALVFYEELVENGVAPEQARFVLPQGMETSWIWTGSLLSFAHVYNLRSDFSHSQRDLREFVEQLDAIMTELFPIAWAKLTHKGA